jgi:transcriptional regulator with XRE-family HTH domain
MTLKLAIVAAGITQRQLAAKTTVITENRLSEIICGWIEPREEEKAAIARVLDQPIELLFGGNAQ